MNIVAVTACPTGIAHTYMAAEQLEKTAILEALKRSNWVQKEAAKLLGVSSRVMNYKVHKFGITHDRWSKNRN